MCILLKPIDDCIKEKLLCEDKADLVKTVAIVQQAESSEQKIIGIGVSHPFIKTLYSLKSYKKGLPEKEKGRPSRIPHVPIN